MFCKNCGSNIDSEICPNCGTKNIMHLETSETPPLKETSSARDTEKIIYECTLLDENNRNPQKIMITPQRVTIGSATYSTANITSVSIAEKAANRFWGVLLALLGIFGLFIAIGAELEEFATIALVLIFAGIILAVLAKGQAYLAIVTAAGEIPALWSQDRKMIRLLVRHIETAIIERG